jgi:hypothetical protein
MTIAVSGQDRTEILQAIDHSFAGRNRDKRLNAIAKLDGSAFAPLKIDFRKVGLLATIKHYGL